MAAGPLHNQTILITRSRSQAAALVQLIQDRGGAVFEFPVITTAPPESWEPLDAAIAGLGSYKWLVITSPNGAEFFFARLTAAGKDARALAHLKVAAVGNATAKALAKVGIKPDVVPSEFRGSALPDAMAPHMRPGDRVLMARANLADPGPAERLRDMGYTVDDVIAYRTLLEGGDVEVLKAALRRGEVQYATFTSSSTVNNLLQRLGGAELLAGVRIAVMGPETAKAAGAAGLRVDVVAEQVSIEGLVNAITLDVASR